MKIGSTGDLHLGIGEDEAIMRVMGNMAKTFEERAVDLIVITGDVFDHLSTPTMRNRVIDIMYELTPVAPVWVVKGNHDAEGDLSFLDCLATPRAITVFDTLQAVQYMNCANFYILPWFTKAAYMRKHQGGSLKTDQDVSKLAVSALASMVALNNRPGVPNILLSHATILGSRPEVDQPMLGDGLRLDPYDLEAAGFDYGIFGHIHAAQEFGTNGRFFYNGSVVPLNYGEKSAKVFSILDTKTGKREVIPIDTVPKVTINLEWKDGALKDLSGKLPQAVLADVKVVVKIGNDDPVSPSDVYQQIEELIKLTGATHSHKIDVVRASKTATRGAEVAAATNMKDKLLALWKATDSPYAKSGGEGILTKLGEIEEETHEIERITS